MKHLRVILLVVAAIMIAFAQFAWGGEMGREQREVSGFDRVVFRAVGELIVTQGENEALVVEAEERLLPKIATEVRGGALIISFKEPQISTQYPIRFLLTVRTLRAIESRASGQIRIGALTTPSLHVALSGSGNLSIDALDAKEFATRVSGAANIAVGGGSVDRQAVTIEGTGDYSAARLASRDATVSISGSGRALVWAKERLAARILGSGDIRYHGDPKIERSITGAGNVARASAW